MIKYIHSSTDTKHFNGVTIAYEVYDFHIKFAYSIVSKPDQYSRKIGRNICTERFDTATNLLKSSSPYHIDTDEMFGYISKEYAFTKIGIYNCFNKNIIGTMQLTDIKNSSLISLISDVVSEHSVELYQL